MLDTSKDILNLAIAAAVIGFTAFVCWGVYYFARILEQVFKIIKEMRARINKIDELLKALREKIEHTTSYLLLISDGVKKIAEIAGNYINNQEPKKKRKT
jgi:hypothetical protein